MTGAKSHSGGREVHGEVNVRFFAPPDDLAACFTTFYKLDVKLPQGKTFVDYLQPEWSNLRFFMRGPPKATAANGSVVDSRFTATGPSSHPTRFEIGTCSMWGIGLMPLGWARYIRAPASDFADTICDGEKTEPFSRFTPLCERLCSSRADEEEQFALITDFFRDAAPPPRDAARILEVHEAMIDPYLIEVGQLADRVGLTKRTLERLCSRHFGFPPRLLLRRQRMMRSLAAFMLSGGKNWSESIDRHYHDQAHFVHEFQSFMRMSPTQYAQMDHPILEAFMVERKRIWGSPVQTLDAPRHDNGDHDKE
ncbi:helix-turn-helix domain-containing protein [Qipengyuania sphaerica]|uniref:helix-turn-helix domain-containing protein n=1 Tax=Qipengyuania sphaerica TaxID=2867243 RepID=UPI001C87EA0C|nr:helix-turn-helix domain-containing protein [Qipengyuania sphaerica]MBX7541400.1 helix-turn-helix domain-containing protein [Qipengyuania sphaerica]